LAVSQSTVDRQESRIFYVLGACRGGNDLLPGRDNTKRKRRKRIYRNIKKAKKEQRTESSEVFFVTGHQERDTNREKDVQETGVLSPQQRMKMRKLGVSQRGLRAIPGSIRAPREPEKKGSFGGMEIHCHWGGDEKNKRRDLSQKSYLSCRVGIRHT